MSAKEIAPREAMITLNRRRVEHVVFFPEQPAMEIAYSEGIETDGGYIPLQMKKETLTSDSPQLQTAMGIDTSGEPFSAVLMRWLYDVLPAN